ncbi:MAG: orotidine 5'-phosphate decarboxylase, orotidine-5'-phosphate decarboxylase [Candidatus Gottesmanbacteria bacterium GW2011_GWA2_43_14]|uniref:Orotidine 5'-phosphate decarboxylase n=1 Tax=Candidatus Gottesmanbacteria bacterium GW2011_GWA2_43_14 TaxID=1618443 RepID=A0A0G1GI81_9BACT|nr:MAG: orotidine 5'-phosphate decarboxylase, orotidine-5'-phosphate decarboxylase [Candidatus Gottesmanbacteria bacterium GW2011_GWA2_43_14]
MKFKDKLKAVSLKNNSLVCIGLDSETGKLPGFIQKGEHPKSTFNKAIIEATHNLVCAYKPNTAFYEALGSAGIEALKMTCDYLKEKYPEIPVIIDAKRADIGNTNSGYVKFIFDYLGADAVTLHPYLGKDALSPFLERADKGIFILCRTSNPGAGEFQDLAVNGKKLFQIVAENVVNNWNEKENCGLVVGATYPAELEIVRHIAGEMPILIPGIGAQGGEIEKTVKAGVDNQGLNAIINSSRNIIFASAGSNFADKACQETLKLRDAINQFRKEFI